MDYTNEQTSILGHDITRHACILAGPGTGKSTTVIALVSQLKETHPDRVIKLLTFTRAANLELSAKIQAAGMEAVESSTVHSFAISILLRNPGLGRLPEPLRIADEWEWKNLILTDLAAKLGVPRKTTEKLKNEMSAEWESLAPEEDPAVTTELRGRFKGVWDMHRQVYGYSLLAELPYRLKGVLEGNPDLDIGGLQIIAVDEYQDLNACDIACIRLLRDRGVVVIAIGDDDQSIYQFRKARPEGIRNFPAEYTAISYPLTISQRLGRNILEWANYVIAQDTGRRGKVPVRPADNNPPGDCRLLVFQNQGTEANGIVGIVRRLSHATPPVPFEEILILARTDELCDGVKGSLRTAGIEFSDPKDGLRLLKSTSGREFLNLLKLVANPSDSLAWWAILQSTPQIGPAVVDSIYNIARNNHHQFGETIYSEIANQFEHVDQRFRERLGRRVTEVQAIIDSLQIPEEAVWGTWLKERVEAGQLPSPGPELLELLVKVDQFHDQTAATSSLAKFTNRLEPMIKDMGSQKVVGKVRIMNMGASKGLTVQATIIVAAEDNIVPHANADEQEERRLLYVAMTRSTNYLFVTRSRTRTGPTARISRPNVGRPRNLCRFLEGGPVTQIDGQQFLTDQAH